VKAIIHMKLAFLKQSYCQAPGRCTTDFKKVTCPACRAIRRELVDK
jgi:hypothetical protein